MKCFSEALRSMIVVTAAQICSGSVKIDTDSSKEVVDRVHSQRRGDQRDGEKIADAG